MTKTDLPSSARKTCEPGVKNEAPPLQNPSVFPSVGTEPRDKMKHRKKDGDPPSLMPEEKGGPAGPEPTRYGDWERKGLARDFLKKAARKSKNKRKNLMTKALPKTRIDPLSTLSIPLHFLLSEDVIIKYQSLHLRCTALLSGHRQPEK